MIITFDDIEQGSPEWLALRAGYVTGTDAYKILRGEPIGRVLANKSSNSWGGNAYTARGHELEPIGRAEYAKLKNVEVVESGFVINSKYPKAGYSPDGLVGEDGLFEHKALNEKNHYANYHAISPQYLAQIQFGLFVTEREWCDFVLYNPDLEKDNLLVKRYYPIQAIQDKFHRIFS